MNREGTSQYGLGELRSSIDQIFPVLPKLMQFGQFIGYPDVRTPLGTLNLLRNTLLRQSQPTHGHCVDFPVVHFRRGDEVSHLISVLLGSQFDLDTFSDRQTRVHLMEKFLGRRCHD